MRACLEGLLEFALCARTALVALVALAGPFACARSTFVESRELEGTVAVIGHLDPHLTAVEVVPLEDGEVELEMQGESALIWAPSSQLVPAHGVLDASTLRAWRASDSGPAGSCAHCVIPRLRGAQVLLAGDACAPQMGDAFVLEDLGNGLELSPRESLLESVRAEIRVGLTGDCEAPAIQPLGLRGDAEVDLTPFPPADHSMQPIERLHGLADGRVVAISQGLVTLARAGDGTPDRQREVQFEGRIIGAMSVEGGFVIASHSERSDAVAGARFDYFDQSLEIRSLALAPELDAMVELQRIAPVDPERAAMLGFSRPGSAVLLIGDALGNTTSVLGLCSITPDSGVIGCEWIGPAIPMHSVATDRGDARVLENGIVAVANAQSREEGGHQYAAVWLGARGVGAWVWVQSTFEDSSFELVEDFALIGDRLFACAGYGPDRRRILSTRLTAHDVLLGRAPAWNEVYLGPLGSTDCSLHPLGDSRLMVAWSDGTSTFVDLTSGETTTQPTSAELGLEAVAVTTFEKGGAGRIATDSCGRVFAGTSTLSLTFGPSNLDRCFANLTAMSDGSIVSFRRGERIEVRLANGHEGELERTVITGLAGEVRATIPGADASRALVSLAAGGVLSVVGSEVAETWPSPPIAALANLGDGRAVGISSTDVYLLEPSGPTRVDLDADASTDALEPLPEGCVPLSVDASLGVAWIGMSCGLFRLVALGAAPWVGEAIDGLRVSVVGVKAHAQDQVILIEDKSRVFELAGSLEPRERAQKTSLATSFFGWPNVIAVKRSGDSRFGALGTVQAIGSRSVLPIANLSAAAQSPDSSILVSAQAGLYLARVRP
ncbi:MAG: hypothetical protein HYV07_22940 [Deltaproteobacteria bacterium]|nr:hypothetical protein [Deltaproteobacteria bacterium]